MPAGDFLLVAGQGHLVAHQLTKSEVSIGRDPACDVAIDDRVLSRRHAILRLGPPLTVQDLDSTNGVRVSRETHHGGAPVTLEAGETFHIGPFSFVIVGADRAEPSSVRRSGVDRLRVDDPTPRGVPGFVRDVATSGVSVLVQGESGSGKDVLAETLHALSGRTGELARVNCAALAEPLIESELFGHEKGAFTGAGAAKLGLLESAEGGTVFLDEIGELPLAIQAKLLRAIESREVLRIGSVRPITIDVRFIAATNRDLVEEVAAKRFRQDLYFRLDGITLMVPPLRERRDRIAGLAMQFSSPAKLAPEVLAALADYDWPGNVRELKAVIERAKLLARGGEIGARHLAFSRRASAPVEVDPLLAALTPAQLEDRKAIVAALEACSGNQTRAAKALGIARTTLVQRIQLYRIARPRS